MPQRDDGRFIGTSRGRKPSPVLLRPHCRERDVVLIQLLLPTTFANGEVSQEATAALADTRRELAEMFDGLTAYVRSPAKGVWTAPDGRTEQDDVVMVEVVTERFDRAWWRTYAATLAERFKQETMHVRAIPIQLLDDGE